MRTRILVAFAAVLCVYHVTGKTTECMEATKAALKYRDYRMKANSAEDVSSMFKAIIKYVNVNLYDDEEIERLMCSIVDAEEKTIASIGSQRHVHVVDDAKQLAFVYSSLMFLLHGSLIPTNFEEHAKKVKFYDSTGFPDFPLAITDAQLSKVLSEMDNSSLANLFWQFADYSGLHTEGVGFKREELHAALKSADSLEDFVRASFVNSENYPDDYDLEDRVSTDAQYIRNDTVMAHEEYHRAKGELLQAGMFLRVLEKTGFLGVTRGGPELYSCDFIADTAVEALGYVVEIFGSSMVQSVMTVHMGLDFTVDDTCAVRAWVCSVVSSKTQAEVMTFLPETVTMHLDPKMIYTQLSFSAQYALNSAFFVGPGMSEIRMAKIAERLNFPLPTDKAKQLAAMLASYSGSDSLDVDAMATILQDANSPEEAFGTGGDYSTWALRKLGNTMETFGGKTDTVVKLASCVYQLGMSAEELGLFMLPPK